VSLPVSLLPLHDAIPATKKKRVLLMDSSRAQRDLRSETMRRIGIDVDCAADVSEARCWWRPDRYDLVLVHVVDAAGPLDRFCNDLRNATPPQRIMFLVGSPAFLSATPRAESVTAAEPKDFAISLHSEAGIALSRGTDGRPPRWGILEACKRISEIRSVCDARTKAIRDRPEPPRDPETSRSSRSVETATIELIKEESQ
jgi:CheY-like chemotaxis protein